MRKQSIIPNGEVFWNRSKYGYKETRIYDEFNYGKVYNFQLYVGYLPGNVSTTIQIQNIQLLEEDQEIGLIDPILFYGCSNVTIEGTIPYDHYLVYNNNNDGPAEVYDANWKFCNTLAASGTGLIALEGDNTFKVTSEDSPHTWLSSRVKVRGNAFKIQKPSVE